MSKVRKPVQNRSIEKLEKILNVGFELFCEKGYYGTNTIEIAKHAGISIGALYSYFKDKRDIFIAAFDQYLDSRSKLLFEKLESLPNPFNLSDFIENWISCYVDIYAAANQALVKLRMMMIEDAEINRHFCNSENDYFLKIVEILMNNGTSTDNLSEKVYASCILVDSLNREKSSFPHNNLNYEILKGQIVNTIYHLLS